MLSSLDFYVMYAKSVLDDLNIPYVDCPVSFMTGKKKRALGNCNRTWDYYLNRYVFNITVNPCLFARDLKDDSIITEVIIHEFIHTCEGAFCHTGLFQTYAQRVNRAFNFHIATKTNAMASGVDVGFKYEIVCKGCGKTVGRYFKKSGIVKAIEKCGENCDTHYKCCGCGSKKFKLIYKR